MDFDRQMCEAGIKDFVRPFLKDEEHDELKHMKSNPLTTHLRIKEIHKGLRHKTEVFIIAFKKE